MLLLPSSGQAKPLHVIDFSDEAHAVESLRILYFANKELLNKIKDNLYDAQNYSSLQFIVSSADNSVSIRAWNEEDGHSCPSPEDIDSKLFKGIRRYFASLEPPHERCYAVSINTYGTPKAERFITFEFGSLESQSDRDPRNTCLRNKSIKLLYSPSLTADPEYQHRLEDDWYIEVYEYIACYW